METTAITIIERAAVALSSSKAEAELTALRREIADIAEQMTVSELNLVLHFCNRSILGRQVAA